MTFPVGRSDHRRTRRSGAFALATAALGLAGAATWLRALDGHLAVGAAEQLPGLAMVAAGLALGVRMRDRRDPRLLVAAGLVWLVGNFGVQDRMPTLAGAAALTLDLPRFLLVWIVLGLPGGMVVHRVDRWLIAAVGVTTGVLAPLSYALGAAPGNPVRIDSPALEGPARAITDVSAFLLVVVIAVRVVRRFARETAAGRRILGPVLLVGFATALADGAAIVASARSDAQVVGFGDGDPVIDAAAVGIVVAWTALALVFFVAVSRVSGPTDPPITRPSVVLKGKAVPLSRHALAPGPQTPATA